MALKLSLQNTLKKYKWNSNHKTGYQKYAVIDIPFSEKGFDIFFVRKFSHQIQERKNGIFLNLDPTDLQELFGKDWYIIQNKHSTTQQRILGMVSMHFRCKTSGLHSRNR